MKKIYEKINGRSEFKSINYPTGSLNGYKYYLNHELREDYWFRYANLVWDMNENNIKEAYQNNFTEFLKVFTDNLYRIRTESLSRNIIDQNFNKQTVSISQFGIYSQINKNEQELENDFVLIENNTIDNNIQNPTHLKKLGWCNIQ